MVYVCVIVLTLFRLTFANSADPVQTPHNAASELGLHCLLTEIPERGVGSGSALFAYRNF